MLTLDSKVDFMNAIMMDTITNLRMTIQAMSARIDLANKRIAELERKTRVDELTKIGGTD